MVKAEIISVGTELLLGQIVNTNAQFLAQQMAELGLALYFQTVVGDNESRLQESLHRALERAQVVILTGGLGPTEDDITREAVAHYLERELVFSLEVAERLDSQFAGREMPANNLRQAYLPSGGIMLPNPHGTAPGIMLETELCQFVFLLPGPPREMQAMFRDYVVPHLRAKGLLQGQVCSWTLHFVGIGESKVAQILEDLIRTQTVPTIALYSRLGEVDVRLTAYAASAALAELIIAPVRSLVIDRLKEHYYGENECTLPKAVGLALETAASKLSLAESCTGGLVGHLITSEPGSSNYFLGSMVCYSNEAKVEVLGVSRETLQKYGAVSEQCAREMLSGAMRLGQATVGLAITGIAGPEGGSDLKPVGTVWLAIGCNSRVQTVKLTLRGDRAAIKERAARLALGHLLNMLRQRN